MAQDGPLPIEQLRPLPGQLASYFSHEELRELAFELQLDHENIPDDTKAAFARELILTLNRELRLAELRDKLDVMRPGVVWALEDVERPAEPPYRGLEFFREQDAGLFFGRDRLAAELINRLQKYPLLTVVGASGSGKSSLVRAGVVPALKRGQIPAGSRTPPAGSRDWAYTAMTPTTHPLEQLGITLTVDLPAATGTPLVGNPRASANHLMSAVDKYLDRVGKPHLFLLVDQFEEVFTACKDEDERRAFIDGLFAIIGGPVTTVLTLRADFYHRCNPYPALRSVLEQHQAFIGALDRDELRAVIVEPAERRGYELEEGLAELMLRDAGDEPGTLPLLSHALLETWRRREGRTMTLDGYNRAGGVHGAIAHSAEKVFNNLDEPGRGAMERIFIELTELGERAEDTRRRISGAELADHPWFQNEGERVLEQLVSARLVTADGDMIQIAHEALIREWPRLHEWLAANRQQEQLRREVAEAARDWEASRRDESYLIEGARLAVAREWAEANTDQLDERSTGFLAASVEHMEREAATARQREVEAANALAAAEARRSRITRRLLYVAGTLAVLAILAAIIGLNRSGEAERQATRAEESLLTATLALGAADQARETAEAALGTTEAQRVRADQNAKRAETSAAEAAVNASLATSRELSAAASNALATDPELSILLALRALEVSHTQQAGEALHQAIQASRVMQSYDTGATGKFGATMAVSPESARLATAGEMAVSIWDMATGDKIRELRLVEPTADHHRLAFNESEDELTLVSASPDHKTVIIQSWTLGDRTSTEATVLPVTHDIATVIDMNHDRTLLAVSRGNRAVEMWDILTGRLVVTLAAHDDLVADLTFDPSGNLLASAGVDGQVLVWEVAAARTDSTPATVAALRSPQSLSETGNLVNAQFVNDHTLVLGYLGQVEVWNLGDLENPSVIALRSAELTRGYAVNEAGTLLATAGQDGVGRIWSLTTGEPVLVLAQHPSPQDGVAFSADGQQLVTIDRDGLLKKWDARLLPLGEQLSLTVDRGVFDLDLSPDGRLVALGNIGGPASLWGAATGERLHVLAGENGGIYRTAFSPDGRHVAGVGGDNRLHVWVVASGREVLSIPAHGEGVAGGLFQGAMDVAYSPDGSRLVTAGADGLAKVWDAESGRRLLTLSGHTDSLHSLAYSPDGRYIATTSDEGDTSVKVWNALSGVEVYSLAGHIVRVWGIAFSPDSRYLLTGGARGIIKLWDLATGKEVYTVFDESDHIGSVSFTPDGRYFITTGETPLRVRRVSDGEVVWTISQPILWSAKVSNDGRWIYAADVNGMVRVLALNLEDASALAYDHLTRWWQPEECWAYLHTVECPTVPRMFAADN